MLTARQHQLLHFIADYQRANRGVSPSFTEMMEGIGAASKSPIHNLLTSLERRGFIERVHGKERAIRICGDQLGAVPDAVLLAECERRNLLERRDAAPVATSADVSRPLGGASARTLSPVTAGRAGGSDSSLLGSSGAFSQTSHGGDNACA